VAARAGVSGRVRSVFAIGGMPAYAGFSLAHPRGRSLAARFDTGYARITASGERARIQRRWMAHERTVPPP
jgi:ABC-type amino acid transport substrate-binding protein